MKIEIQKITHVNKLIIGCGASGLFFGSELLRSGENNFLILEKENRTGGLCRSFKIGSQYYDIGAHALHKKAIDDSEGLRREINVKNLYCQKRHAKVYIFNKLIPHPFQLHLYYAPLKIKLKCLVSYLVRNKRLATNLHDWLQSEFGNQVCKIFLFPYNEKAWKIDLKKISINWVKRVSSGPSKFFSGLLFAGDQNYNSNEYVCYPSNGGFENILSALSKKLTNKVVLNCEITSVDFKNKIVVTNSGCKYSYDFLISTLPVDLLIKKISTINDKKLLSLVNLLENVSTCLVTFLTNKKIAEEQRIYVPGNEYLAQRVIINSNSSHSLKSGNESVYSLEISYKNLKKLPSKNYIINNCEMLLKDLNLIDNNSDIKECRVEFFEYMYPTQTINLSSTIKKLKKELEELDCFSIGRFGSWNYANIDGIYEEINSLIKSKF